MKIEPQHLSLQGIVDRLRQEPPAKLVAVGFSEPHSYRGYYDEVAFVLAKNVTVAYMLSAAESAIGAAYQGWKGGDYVMSDWTSAWLVVDQGCCGESIGAVLLELMLANESEGGAR